MSNIHAAIGLAQLERVNYLIKKILFIIFIEMHFLKNGLSISDTPEYAKNNNWLNILKLDFKILKKNALNKIIKKLKRRNIETRLVWQLNHLQKFKHFQNIK